MLARSPNTAPPIRSTCRSLKIRPTSAGQPPSLRQAKSAFNRANELFEARADLEAGLSTPPRSLCRPREAAYEVALQNARNLAASIQASEAAAKLSDRQLRDTEIRAPFDGYVEKRLVSPGELVKAQMPVMGIVRIDPLKVTAEIPERMAPWIDDGRTGGDSRGCLSRPRRSLERCAHQPGGQPATRAFPFEGVVPNADGALKPGTFARVQSRAQSR